MKKYILFKAPDNDRLYTLKEMVVNMWNEPERNVVVLEEKNVLVEEVDSVDNVPGNVVVLNTKTGEVTWGTM